MEAPQDVDVNQNELEEELEEVNLPPQTDILAESKGEGSGAEKAEQKVEQN